MKVIKFDFNIILNRLIKIKKREFYNLIRIDNYFKIIKDFYFYYLDKFRSKKLIIWKNEKKTSWKLRIFFYYLLWGLYLLIIG